MELCSGQFHLFFQIFLKKTEFFPYNINRGMSKYFLDVIVYYAKNYRHFSIDYSSILTYIFPRYTWYITASCIAWLSIRTAIQ